jgi:hypothetical protein
VVRVWSIINEQFLSLILRIFLDEELVGCLRVGLQIVKENIKNVMLSDNLIEDVLESEFFLLLNLFVSFVFIIIFIRLSFVPQSRGVGSSVSTTLVSLIATALVVVS